LWPVFLPISMFQDHGNQFAVGDVIAWEVVLVDAEALGWPQDRLVDTIARIVPRPAWARGGSLADTGALCVCWRGSHPVDSVLAFKAGLVADFWNPPIPSTLQAKLHRIEVIAQRAARDQSGVWMPPGRGDSQASRAPGRSGA
jgi:hypothetical protein